MAAIGQEAQFDRGQREFFAELGISTAQFLRDAGEGGIDGQTGFGADHEEVERVGEALADRRGPLRNLVVEPQIRRLVAADQRRSANCVALERAPFGEAAQAVDVQQHAAAKDHRQNIRPKNHRDGPLLRTDPGLQQLDLRGLELFVLKHLQSRQQRPHAIGGFVLGGQARTALAGRGDDAGLELLAPLVERLDAPGHGILDLRRGIDRHDRGEHGDGGHQRRHIDDVDAEKGRWCGSRVHRVRSRS